MRISEPANGEWAAVKLSSGAVRAFQRLDHLSADDKRWWMDGFPDHRGADARSWQELCDLGPVALIGEFS
jgi:hypothetical protein